MTKKLRVTVEGKVFEVTVEMLDEHPAGEHKRLPAWVPPTPRVPSPAAETSAEHALAPAATPRAAPVAVVSPLAGKVVAFNAKVGDAVAEGAQLLTLEAMKMNTFVFAPKAGIVSAVHANPGDAVEEGAALLTLT